MPRSLKYGLEMLVAHCAATGRQELDAEFVTSFLQSTPYANAAAHFKPDNLMPSAALQ